MRFVGSFGRRGVPKKTEVSSRLDAVRKWGLILGLKTAAIIHISEMMMFGIL